MTNNNFIGIDLGTTYSCIGVYKNDKVEIISNDNGNRTTPSYVAFDGLERYIGESAKEQLSQNASNTIFDVKRLIGRDFDDETIQNDLHHYPFKIIKGENNVPLIEVMVGEEVKLFRPEEISAMILQKVKEDAEKYLMCTVTDAVITVPAYFNDRQRQATKDAGKIAGLNVLRIINEPTAAAIAYNLNSQSKNLEDRYVLIFDLGGGTFDVTILVSTKGVLEVKATSGDTHLGGEDFDNKLVDFCMIEFAKKAFKPTISLNLEETKKVLTKYNISSLSGLYRLPEDEIKNKLIDLDEKSKKYINDILKIKLVISDISTNSRMSSKLKKACENAKKVLSINETTNVMIDTFYFDDKQKSYDLKVTITRDIFEKICEHEFLKCLEPIDMALRDAKITERMINDVVLIGGSTRIPKIKQILQEKFGQDKLRTDINPDEAVAYGATVQAAIIKNVDDEKIRDLVLLDVIPLTLGLETAGGVMTKLLKRNTTVPCDAEQIFSTYSDNQPGVTIKVLEGERSMAKDCNILATLNLEGIPPMPKQVPKIRVKFSIDENCIMTVTATEESTGKTNHISIKNDKGRLSEDQINNMIAESEKFSQLDKEHRESVEAKIAFENCITSMSKKINSELFQKIMGEEIYSKLSNMITNVMSWLEDNENRSADEYKQIKLDFENELKEYMDDFQNKQNNESKNKNIE